MEPICHRRQTTFWETSDSVTGQPYHRSLMVGAMKQMSASAMPARAATARLKPSAPPPAQRASGAEECFPPPLVDLVRRQVTGHRAGHIEGQRGINARGTVQNLAPRGDRHHTLPACGCPALVRHCGCNVHWGRMEWACAEFHAATSVYAGLALGVFGSQCRNHDRYR